MTRKKLPKNYAYAILLNMKRNSGYTIVEVMIVLAISAGLFGSVYASFTIQNNRRLFTEAVHTVEKNLLDVTNDVENGFYPSSKAFTCAYGATGPTLSSSAVGVGATDKEQGAKQDCIYLGKAVQFNPIVPSDPVKAKLDRFAVYTIAGNRLRGASSNIADTSQTLSDAQPTLITRDKGGEGVIVDERFSNGPAYIYKVTAFDANGADYPIGGFAIVNGLGGASQLNPKPGSIRAGIIPIAGTGLGENPNGPFFTKVNGLTAPTLPSRGGILICMGEQEGGGGRKASIRIASGGQSTSTVVNFDQLAEDEGCV